MSKLFSTASILFGAFLAASTLSAQTARVKVIHNCADPAADTVDVWVDNTLLLDNFAFRTSSAFVNATAGTPITLGVAPKNSMSASQALEQVVTTLVDGETYIITASGNLGTGFTPATGFTLEVFADASETATIATNTDILVFHGSTDAPTVDVRSQDLSTALINDLSYPQYSSYLQLPTNDLVISLTGSTGTLIQRYSAPLATLSLTGAAITVVASGYLDPSVNNNGEAFGLWVATAAAGNMLELPLFVESSVVDLRAANFALNLFPMPANTQLNAQFSLPSASSGNVVLLADMSGRVVYQQSLGALEAGEHSIQLPLNDLATGQYTLMLSTAIGRQTLPVSVVK